MEFVQNILVFLLLSALHVQRGNGISCYECGTSTSPLCTSPDVGSLELQQCSQNLSSCAYAQVVLNGDHTMMRFCTDQLFLSCPDLPFPSGIDWSNAECWSLHSCSGEDGCNNEKASFTPVNPEPVDPATLLSCYQCGIDGARACDAQGVGNLSPTKCSSHHKYCVSVKATTIDGITVQRYCSQTAVTNCNSVFGTVNCDVNSCEKDGCNAARLVKASVLTMLVVAFLCLSYTMI